MIDIDTVLFVSLAEETECQEDLLLELEDHVKFSTIMAYTLNDLFWIAYTWHFSYTKGIILLQDRPETT